jgi:hypothetical protein
VEHFVGTRSEGDVREPLPDVWVGGGGEGWQVPGGGAYSAARDTASREGRVRKFFIFVPDSSCDV